MNPVHSADAPAAIGPYSQAIVHNGLVYCSGQIAAAFAGGFLQRTAEEIQAETAAVLQNLDAVLIAAGTSRAHVLKTTVFLSNMDHFPAMNTAYAAFFGDHKPARATVAVAGLPRDVHVEIDCIAAVMSTHVQ